MRLVCISSNCRNFFLLVLVLTHEFSFFYMKLADCGSVKCACVFAVALLLQLNLAMQLELFPYLSICTHFCHFSSSPRQLVSADETMALEINCCRRHYCYFDSTACGILLSESRRYDVIRFSDNYIMLY